MGRLDLWLLRFHEPSQDSLLPSGGDEKAGGKKKLGRSEVPRARRAAMLHETTFRSRRAGKDQPDKQQSGRLPCVDGREGATAGEEVRKHMCLCYVKGRAGTSSTWIRLASNRSNPHGVLLYGNRHQKIR